MEPTENGFLRPHGGAVGIYIRNLASSLKQFQSWFIGQYHTLPVIQGPISKIMSSGDTLCTASECYQGHPGGDFTSICARDVTDIVGKWDMPAIPIPD